MNDWKIVWGVKACCDGPVADLVRAYEEQKDCITPYMWFDTQEEAETTGWCAKDKYLDATICYDARLCNHPGALRGAPDSDCQRCCLLQDSPHSKVLTCVERRMGALEWHSGWEGEG